jgi:hypothetical protein
MGLTRRIVFAYNGFRACLLVQDSALAGLNYCMFVFRLLSTFLYEFSVFLVRARVRHSCSPDARVSFHSDFELLTCALHCHLCFSD